MNNDDYLNNGNLPPGYEDQGIKKRTNNERRYYSGPEWEKKQYEMENDPELQAARKNVLKKIQDHDNS